MTPSVLGSEEMGSFGIEMCFIRLYPNYPIYVYDTLFVGDLS